MHFRLMKTAMSTSLYIQTDVLVIGGGPAGLAASLGLSRVLVPHIICEYSFSHRHHSTFMLIEFLIVDGGRYRNDPAKAIHNVLGFDNVSPFELRARAREEIEAYRMATFITPHQVQTIEKTGKGTFVIDGQWEGKGVILATGIEDILPATPGTFVFDCFALTFY